MFEDLADAFSERTGEAFEKQVRIGFGDCTTGWRGEIMTEEYIVQGEGCGGAVWKVGDCEGGWGAAVFVEEEEVAKPRRVC